MRYRLLGIRVVCLSAILCVLCWSSLPVAAKTNVLTPQATGAEVLSSSGVTVDASNTANGYVMVKYSGSNSKIKIIITKKGGSDYTYNINARGQYEVFPLTEGSGSYTIAVFENVSGSQYAQAFSKSITVSIENAFSPFLYPNQYVNFTAGSAAVKKAEEFAGSASTDMALVSSVYNYVINNVSYDFAKANSVKSGYLPSVDGTLASKKGICFDYAALMTAMLRSQGIPTKLVVGFAGDVYHAWINVYLKEVGWVDNVIYFDGKSWKLMDPTFASSGKGDPSIQKFIGDGANYKSKYAY